MAGRWGSFISGLESKLDTILADEESTSKARKDEITAHNADNRTASAVPARPKQTNESPRKSSSTNRAQDRLNERLAKAMANRVPTLGGDSIASSVGPSRTTSPATVGESLGSNETVDKRQFMDQSDKLSTGVVETKSEINEDHAVEEDGPLLKAERREGVAESPGRDSVDSDQTQSIKPPITASNNEVAGLESSLVSGLQEKPEESSTPEVYRQIIQQMRSDYQAAEARRQEETHEYLERIDALQSKLQYLTRETAEIAKKNSSTAESGSVEQKLAARDERIALLMEEGHKLSQTELRHMCIIRKLRAKSIEDEKQLSDLRRKLESHEKGTRELQDRAQKAEAAERQATEKIRSLSKLGGDVALMRGERDNQLLLIQSLEKHILDTKKAAEEVDTKVHRQALENEKQRTSAVADELSRFRLETELAEKTNAAEIRELKEKLQRDNERTRLAEIEWQSEHAILESRLEAFRARLEEASTGSSGHVQAKLLRQIETLQNQYAIASENWQGIEGSLLARIENLETEKDNTLKREADIRRKAREMSLKSKRVEEDSEKAMTETLELQDKLTQLHMELTNVQGKLRMADLDVVQARKSLQAEREAWELREAHLSEEAKARQRATQSHSSDALSQQTRPNSPVASARNRKSSNPDGHSPRGRRYHALAVSGAPINRPASRRSSTQPVHSVDTCPISRQDSATFGQSPFVNGLVPQTPSINVHNQNDFFENVRTPVSQESTINDMVSASTGGAGPSVQLVERMSAAVRRLESEKASSKDDIHRLSQQRDEARDQAVSLMKEVDAKRKIEDRVKALEQENRTIQERYLTTLEMLGEKSEKVEELKADVTDLKQMYRELVDNTLR